MGFIFQDAHRSPEEVGGMSNKSKEQKADAAIEKGKAVAETVKQFTPPEIDNAIDRGEQAVEIGWGVFRMLKSILKKKK